MAPKEDATAQQQQQQQGGNDALSLMPQEHNNDDEKKNENENGSLRMGATTITADEQTLVCRTTRTSRDIPMDCIISVFTQR